MPEPPLAAIVGRLVRGLPRTDGTADAALLARFVGWRDEAAFELLVYRHGPMVRGLCRRVLRHEQDAEDAFQATFLALARKAAAVRGQSLAGWLYRVAFHAALKARARSVRRSESSLPEIAANAISPADDLHDRELRAVLDEEVMRLPQRFRLPVVLCYLQGRSNSEAAAALGVPKGTIDSRLATARQRLRLRLVRRGLAPTAAAAVLDSAVTAAEVSGPVARALAKAAAAFLSNQPAAGVVPAAAAVLAEGVLHTMFVTKLKWAAAAVLALAVLGSGAGMATYGGRDDSPKAEQKEPERHKNPPGAKITTVADERKDAGPRTAAAVRKILQQQCTVERAIDNAPLKDVLDYLSDKYDVSIRLDPAAFIQFRELKPYDAYDHLVRLPAGRNLTLADVLREILSQVRTPTESVPVTYVVKGTRIAIVPTYLLPMARTLGEEQPFLDPSVIEEQVEGEPVSIEIKDKPIAEALQELADATGTNIVLDNRCREQGAMPVTLTLQNVRLFTALRVIGDMADLQPTTVGNVYYITSRDNAERLHKQEWLKPAPGSKALPAAKPPPPSKSGDKWETRRPYTIHMLNPINFNDIPPGTDLPRVVNVIVEIPKGRRSKFEVDKKTGLIRLDRYLYSSSHYPGDYGFIPQTLAEDGDPLDVVVMVNEPTFSGCLIEARVVGLFRMKDKGKYDYKVFGVPHSDPLFAEVQNLGDVPAHFLREVEHFFATYKQLEGAKVEPMGWAAAQDAIAEVKASVERYRAKAEKG